MTFPDSCGFYGFEPVARAAGYHAIAGVDEVGRGPLAGPVVAVAAIVHEAEQFAGLNDSKKVTEKRRDTLYELLANSADVQYGVASITPAEIDRINILQATHKAMRLAIAALPTPADFVLVDGRPVPRLRCDSHNLIKGDGRCASIAAASILAKVIRDRQMVAYDEEFPGYSFASHKGYGTAAHLAALRSLGACPIHRRSFAPVRDVVEPTLFDS